MTAHRAGAWALISGAALAMLVFAFHPAHVDAHPMLGPFTLSQLIHGTALVAVPLLVLGMWQMADWIGLARAAVRLALVLAALAMMLTANAAVISNWVTPVAARASFAATPHQPTRHPRPMTLDQMPAAVQVAVATNRGFAQVHVAFLSLALMLFGWALWRRRRVLGAAGIAVGLYPLLWQLSGRFSPETTTMPWVVFPQSAWMIAAAIAMLRDKGDDQL